MPGLDRLGETGGLVFCPLVGPLIPLAMPGGVLAAGPDGVVPPLLIGPGCAVSPGPTTGGLTITPEFEALGVSPTASGHPPPAMPEFPEPRCTPFAWLRYLSASEVSIVAVTDMPCL